MDAYKISKGVRGQGYVEYGHAVLSQNTHETHICHLKYSLKWNTGYLAEYLINALLYLVPITWSY